MKNHLKQFEKAFQESSTSYDKVENNNYIELILFSVPGYPSHHLKFKKDGSLIPSNSQPVNGEAFAEMPF